LIIKKYGITTGAVIGDRLSDKNAAKKMDYFRSDVILTLRDKTNSYRLISSLMICRV